MNKINPKIVKGEPECSEECPYFKRIGFGNKDTLSKSYYWCDEMKDKTNDELPCIPGLRQQRDGKEDELIELTGRFNTALAAKKEAEKERDRFIEDCDSLKRSVTKLNSEKLTLVNTLEKVQQELGEVFDSLHIEVVR